MTMVRNQFYQAMSIDVAHNFIEYLDLKQRSVEFRSIFNVLASKKAYEDAVHYAGTGPAIPKNEGEAIYYDVLIQGGTRRYIHQTFGLGFRASYELMQDDQTGLLASAPKSLVQGHIFAQEMTAGNVFNLGFSSTGTITDDGVSLFNNQHPLLGGATATNIAPGVGNFSTASGTYPNRPAVDADLSFTSLQYGTMVFQRMPNGRGIVIATKPKHLRIPPELEYIAIELLGSAGKPYTSDNEVNALLAANLTYEVNHYFTSPSAWFLTGNKDEHRLMFYERQPIHADRDRDFDQQALKYLTLARYSAGADNFYNLFGSNGP